MTWGQEDDISNLEAEDDAARVKCVKMSNALLDALRKYEKPLQSIDFREGIMLGLLPTREGLISSQGAMCRDLADPKDEARERHRIVQGEWRARQAPDSKYKVRMAAELEKLKSRPKASHVMTPMLDKDDGA